MYLAPQPHKCIKCGYEMDYSEHDANHPAPVTPAFTGCPKCWQQFLLDNIGELKCTVDFLGRGSEYERTKNT